jgi:hypothetical protein
LTQAAAGCSWDWDRYADHRTNNSTTCATGVSDQRIARLSRGIDMYGWLVSSTSFTDFVSDADLKRFAQAGVTFIRASFYVPLPTAGGATSLLDPTQPDQLNPTNLVYFRQAIDRARAAGLGIVFVPYFDPAYKQQLGDPTTQASSLDALLRMWKQLGSFINGYDPDWVFPELMGAPDFTDSDGWNKILLPLAQTVRQVAPAHTIIADGNSGSYRVDWNSITALSRLQTVPNERNVIYGFIFFDPVIFTHQGADWRPEWPELQYIKGLPYPSSPALVAPALPGITDTAARADAEYYGNESWGPDLLSIGLDKVADWSAQNCARVMCVEYGVFRQNSPPDSAARWVNDARTLLEARHILWSYWSYKEHGGLQPTQAGPLFEPAIAASLGLTE